MASSFIAGVYPENTFDTENPDSQQQQAQAAAAQNLATSGMGAVMLASFHVSAEGDINYNDTPIVSGGSSTGLLNPNLPTLLQQIQGAGATLLASFGGGGMFNGNAVGYWDFSHIMALIQQYPDPADNPFFQNLAVLFETYPAITGFDVDLECAKPSQYAQFTSTVVDIVQWLNGQGLLATLCPYEVPSFWTGVLQQCYVNDVQQVAWVNLQNAVGAASGWVTDIQNANVGWSNVPGQILAGQQIGQGTPASDVQATFYEIGQEQSGLRGGWLWTYEDMNTPASDYVSAIQDGLGGTK
jgi:hypothetical protein